MAKAPLKVKGQLRLLYDQLFLVPLQLFLLMGICDQVFEDLQVLWMDLEQFVNKKCSGQQYNFQIQAKLERFLQLYWNGEQTRKE